MRRLKVAGAQDTTSSDKDTMLRLRTANLGRGGISRVGSGGVE